MNILLIALNKIDTLPLALGYLQSYSETDGRIKERCRFKIANMSVEESTESILDQIKEAAPDLLGFSCYVWNVQKILELCHQIKRFKPECTIVLGGPEVTPRHKEILDKNPSVDIVARGEGELTFSELLHNLILGIPDLGQIKGLSYRKGGKIYANLPRGPIADLDLIPSPYLNGIFSIYDSFYCPMETTRGCVFECSHCCYSKEFKEVRCFSLERVKAELKMISDVGKSGVISFLDPTFNLNRDRLRKLCDYISQIGHKGIQLHAEVRADLVDEEMAGWLQRANFSYLEAGLQSANKEVLEKIGRPCNLDRFKKGVLLLGQKTNCVEVQLIMGLPNDTFPSLIDSIRYVLSLAPTRIRIFPLAVLPGSKLASNSQDFGIEYEPNPPYQVRSTNTLSAGQIDQANKIITVLQLLYDKLPKTVSFLGRDLSCNTLDICEMWREWSGGQGAEERQQLIDHFPNFLKELCRENGIDFCFYEALFTKEMRTQKLESRTVGVDSISAVVQMEHHNDAYSVWRQNGIRDRVLIHIDAHIDFGWIADEDPEQLLNAKSRKELEDTLSQRHLWNLSQINSKQFINIGNYIYPAMKEGIVKVFYWVVPDPVWEKRRERKKVVRALKNIVLMSSHPKERVDVREDIIETRVDGRPILALPLKSLPRIEETVLLDIDTDFMVTSSITDWPPYYSHKRVYPWIWPEDLVSRLAAKNIRSDLVTVAYSIEGGYTPLRYRTLGDEIANLIRSPSLVSKPSQHSLRRREAWYLCKQERFEEAISIFNEMVKEEPGDAAAHYSLSRLYSGIGEEKKSAYHHLSALDIDPAYRTPYNNYGLKYLTMELIDKADREYTRVLSIDPKDFDALIGRGKIYTRKKDWRSAEEIYLEAIRLNGNNISAHDGLGYVYIKTGRPALAIKVYKAILAREPQLAGTHYRLGQAYAQQGDIEEAISEYRTARRYGLDSIGLRLALASLYRKKRNRYKATKEYRKALYLIRKLGPIFVWRLLKFPKKLPAKLRCVS